MPPRRGRFGIALALVALLLAAIASWFLPPQALAPLDTALRSDPDGATRTSVQP